MSKRKIEMPSDAEEKRIGAGIAFDPDNPEWDDDMFARAKRGRGPQKAPKKKPLTMRLDPDIVEWLRSKKGYSGLVNETMREKMQEELR